MTKKHLGYIAIVALVISTIIITIIHKPESPDRKRSGTFSVEMPESVSVKAFEVGAGWGYEIVVNGDPFINQEFIPGVGGQIPFMKQEDALKCGELVIQKLKNKKNPSVTLAELDSLCIQYK